MSDSAEQNGSSNLALEAIMTGGMRFDRWCILVGISRPDGYRMREEGMIQAHRVGTKLWVGYDDIALFWSRVKAGEFEGKLAGICTPEGMEKAKVTRAAKRLKKKAPANQNN